MWNRVIEYIMQNSTVNINPEDYKVDGLLYCGKCNTPKQCRIKVGGKVLEPYALCKCAVEELAKEEQADRNRSRLQQIESNREQAFSGSSFKGWTFDKDGDPKSKVAQVARKYVTHFRDMDGSGLCLFGTIGTGKTFYAACILNALIDKGYTGLITTMSAVADRKYDGDMSELMKVDLLVIDDFGAERKTDYMAEIAHDVIDARYRAKKPVIVTTNLTATELKSPTDLNKQRVYSRILEMCIPIEVIGNDKRRDHLRENYRKYKDMLGL